ncbi:unnamed protein product [Urochloa decumbens]|uniref:No apical meristem-associated C-terminal domain-containing protein n=1 Tax=Urochloa decumbens TaxID=240449 RepID=A0ABC9D972_9POAL
MDPAGTPWPPNGVRPSPNLAPLGSHPSRPPPPAPLGPRPPPPSAPSGPPRRRQGRLAVAPMEQERQTVAVLEQPAGAGTSRAQKSKAQTAAAASRKSKATCCSASQPTAPPCNPLVDATMANTGEDAHNLLDTSGGGFFTDMMGDGIALEDFSMSMPYEQEEYADEADFEVPAPTAKKAHSRSTNYTTQEDEALIMAWESVSLDAMKGNDQTSSTYWSRIYDHYHRNKKCVPDRSLVSLQHRWSTIQECCNKWAGCLVQVERQNPSGVPYQEHVNLALELYKVKKPKKGKPFVMLHCWALLQHNQEWLTRKDEAPPKRQKSRSSSLEFDVVREADDSGVQDEEGRGRSPTPSSGVPTRTRPPGRKAEKEKLKKVEGGAYKEVFQEMITRREEMEAHKETRWIEVKAMEEWKAAVEERKAAVEERKAEAEERKVAIEEEKLRVMSEKVLNKKLEQEQKIMFMDMSCLDDVQKAYVSATRAQILAARMGGTSSGIGGV